MSEEERRDEDSSNTNTTDNQIATSQDRSNEESIQPQNDDAEETPSDFEDEDFVDDDFDDMFADDDFEDEFEDEDEFENVDMEEEPVHVMDTVSEETMQRIRRSLREIFETYVETDDVVNDMPEEEEQQTPNITIPQQSIADHAYLSNFNREEEIAQEHLVHEIDGQATNQQLPISGTHKVCIIPLQEMIPFPGQKIPYVTSNPSIVVLLLQILGLRSSSEESQLFPCVVGFHQTEPDEESDNEIELKYGCLVKVEKAHFDESGYCLGVLFTCEQKCILLDYQISMTRVITGNVEIMQEHNDCVSPLPSCLPTAETPIQNFPLLGRSALIPHRFENLERKVQKTAVKVLVSSNAFYSKLSDSDILSQIPADTVALSYLLVRQLLLNYTEERSVFLLESSMLRIQRTDELCRELVVIHCKCHQKLVHFLSYQRLNLFGGNCVKGVFVNRYGVAFTVITSKSIMNVRMVTEPSAEDTWFPGYKWEIMECSRCHRHAGWRFSTEEDLQPKVFYAIPQSSIYYSDH